MLQVIKQFCYNLDCKQNKQKIKKIDNYKQLIHELSTLQLLVPKLFTKNIQILINILQTYVKSSNPYQIIYIYQIILSNVQTCVNKYRCHKLSAVIKLFGLICYEIAKIIQEDSLKWLDLQGKQCYGGKKEEFEEGNTDVSLIVDYGQWILKIVQCIDFGDEFEKLTSALFDTYQKGGLKIKAAVYICISKLYSISQLQNLHPIINFIYRGITNPNQLIRYYSIYTLMNYIQYLYPNFGIKYMGQFFMVIVNGFNDLCQEVARQWVRCLKKVVELGGCQKYVCQQFQGIVNRICYFLQYSKDISTKQISISLLTSLSTVPRLLIKQRVERILQICDIILKNFKEPAYKTLTNKTIECITSSIAYSDYKISEQYINYGVQMLIQLWKLRKLDAITGFICVSNLCATGIKFQKFYLIYEYVMGNIKSWEGRENVSQNEKIQGFDTIGVVVECFREDFGGFAVQTLEILFGLLKEVVQGEEVGVIDQLSEAIEKILQQCKTQLSKPQPHQILRQLLKYYVKTCSRYDVDDSWQIRQYLLITLKLIINEYGRQLITKNDIDILWKKIWQVCQFLKNQKRNRIKNKNQGVNNNQFQEEQEDIGGNYHKNNGEDKNQQPEESSQELQDDQEMSSLISQCQQTTTDIDKCRMSLTDIFKSLLKLNPDTLPSMLSQISEQIQKSINERVDDGDITYAVMFICALVEELSFEELGGKWYEFMKYLVEYCGNLNTMLRQSVVYCLGLMIEKMTDNFGEQMINTWIQALKRAYLVPKSEDDEQHNYGNCQDNCISALGKLIMRYHNKYNIGYLYQQWLQRLPLKYDQIQNKIQMQYIYNIIKYQPEILFQNRRCEQNGWEVVYQVLKIFGRLKSYLDKLSRNQSNVKLYKLGAETVNKILEWKVFKESQDKILGLLNEEEKFDLNALVKNY